MKKIIMSLAALSVLSVLAFAKPAKVDNAKLGGLNSVSKIAKAAGMDVLENSKDGYCAKTKDGKDFVIFAEEVYSDGHVTVSVASVGGKLYSKATLVLQGDGKLTYTLLEGEKRASFNNGGSSYVTNDEGIAAATNELMYKRAAVRLSYAEKYGLALPESVKASDAGIKQSYEAANKAE